MDKTNYVEKVMDHLNTENFKELTTDKTKTVEESIQRVLLQTKTAIGESDYKTLYPSGSNPGKFYGTAKVHKIKPDEQNKIEKFPLRPIISNIGTATHKTAQYLCNLLSPLALSNYTVQNTNQFVNEIKNMTPPDGYVAISFDVVSLFTNVPLRKTIDIILRKVYDEKLIRTDIPKKNLEKLLLLCTQGTPFTFDNKMYVQVDGVMMGSPLRPLFANIFMSELENTIIPTLGNKVLHWKRYVDDTFAFIKPGTADEIQHVLNSFHEKIKFTYEYEQSNTISFLDVLVTRSNDGTLQTSVYRKQTHTDVYLNWNAHAPTTWKISTIRSLVKRAFSISSTETALNHKLSHLQKVFTTFNNYPNKVVDNIINTERTQTVNTLNEEDQPLENNETVTLTLPYAGQKGELLMKKMKKTVTDALNNPNNKVQVIYNTKKLSSNFPVKDKTNPHHQHNVVYHAECPEPNCSSNYTGQTKCRLLKRVIQHNRTDKNSHLLKHSSSNNHHRIWMEDFKILGSGYKSNFKRKISEALFIKEKKPDLNVQKDAYTLKLYH